MKRKDILVSAGALIVAALVLFGAGKVMEPALLERAAAEEQTMLKTLLPGSETFTEEVYDGEDAAITALWSGNGGGYVVETTVDGYAAPIVMWCGVDGKGNITGLVVRDMNETDGLGREALTDMDWLNQFVGTNGSAEVGTNVDAITGATVTSKAIAKAVNAAAAYVTGADVSTGATEWGG